jgi:hypothetical protein
MRKPKTAPSVLTKVDVPEVRVRRPFHTHMLVDSDGARHFVEGEPQAINCYNSLVRQGATVEVFKLVKLNVETTTKFLSPLR